MSALTIRQVDPAAERERIMSVLAGSLPAAALWDRFDWLYLENPEGPALVWLAEQDGVALGTSAAHRRRMRVDGRIVPVQAPQHRFAAVVHLLSYANNRRLRVRCFAPDDALPVVPSVTGLWPGANWFEREAFDLYGIVFEGHPDLRRILTDYGFVGHPFRKDFPLIGNVEVRYDEERRRVVYEPVTSVEPRVGVPRVIREDARYETAAGEAAQREAAK